MIKKDLVNELKDQGQNLGGEYEEEEDLEGSVWLPVIIDKKVDKVKKKEMLSDPSVKEMDLAQISEKEVFVRLANLVSIYFCISSDH